MILEKLLRYTNITPLANLRCYTGISNKKAINIPLRSFSTYAIYKIIVLNKHTP